MSSSSLPPDIVNKRYIALCNIYGCKQNETNLRNAELHRIIVHGYTYICEHVSETKHDIWLMFRDETSGQCVSINMLQFLYGMLPEEEYNSMKTATCLEDRFTVDLYGEALRFQKGSEYRYRFFGNDIIQVFADNHSIPMGIDHFTELFKTHSSERIGKCFCYRDFKLNDTTIYKENDIVPFGLQKSQARSDDAFELGVFLSDNKFYKMEESLFNDHFIVFDGISTPVVIFCIMDYGYPVLVYQDRAYFFDGIWCSKSNYYQMRVYGCSKDQMVDVINGDDHTNHMISQELVSRFFLIR